MNENAKTTSIYLSITLIALILLFIFAHFLRKDSEKRIISNLGYSIGILRNVTTAGTPMKTEVYFDFKANSKAYNKMKNKGKIIGYKEAVQRAQYLVIYDTENPENCQILFDYPIKDSTDFIRYLEGFKSKPLNISKYF